MRSFLAISFVAAFIIQPFEWIPIFGGVPFLEILILLIVALTAALDPGRFLLFFKQQPTRYFILFILIAMFSNILNNTGGQYAISITGASLGRTFLAYMVITLGLISLANIRSALIITMLSCALVGILCIRLYYTGEGVGDGIGATVQQLNWRGGVQWLGDVEGSNNTALLLVTGFGLSIGLLFKTEKNFIRLLSIISCALIIFAVLLTGSRGGFLGLIGVMALFTVLKYRIRVKKFIPYAIVLGVIVIMAIPSVSDRGLKDSSSNERVDLLYHGLNMVKENPFFGVGHGQFADNNPVRKVAHNIYLQKVAETGLIGGSLFFLMFYAAIRNSNRFYEENKDNSVARNSAISIWCGALGFAICAFFLTANHYLPYIVLALMTALSMAGGENTKISFAEIRRVLVVEILVVLLVYIAVNLYMMFLG